MIDPVYCIHCRKPLDKADTFCRYCGADQRRPAASPPPEQTVSMPASGPMIPPDAIPIYYKTCSVCGQPAVLSMPVCGRCGAPFPPTAGAGSAAEPILPGTAPALPSRPNAKRRGMALALLGVLLALLLGVGVISMNRSPQAPAAGDTAGSLVQSSGPFHERPSPLETPTITITSTVPEAAVCVFQDHAGHAYELRVDPGQTASIQVPAGDYDFQIEPGNPAVHGESGDATFRRYRAYDLTLTEEESQYPPMRGHIGDSP